MRRAIACTGKLLGKSPYLRRGKHLVVFPLLEISKNFHEQNIASDQIKVSKQPM